MKQHYKTHKFTKPLSIDDKKNWIYIKLSWNYLKLMIEANKIYLFMVDKEVKMFVASFSALTQLFHFLHYSQSILGTSCRSPKYLVHLIFMCDCIYLLRQVSTKWLDFLFKLLWTRWSLAPAYSLPLGVCLCQLSRRLHQTQLCRLLRPWHRRDCGESQGPKGFRVSKSILIRQW